MRSRLPDYERPPVVEAYCGIYFRDLLRMMAPQVGLFWQAIRTEFPGTQTHPVLPPLFTSDLQQAFIIKTLGGTIPRTWFVSEDQTMLVQLQGDRLILNWRKNTDANEYPRFQALKQEFLEIVQKFEQFVKSELSSALTVTGIELGYVNAIIFDNELQSMAQYGEVVPELSFAEFSRSMSVKLEFMNATFQFTMPNDRGSIFVTSQNAFRPEDGRQFAKLDVYARWQNPEIEMSAVADWLDDAHEKTVLAFSRVTSDNFQVSKWGRKQ